MSGSSVENSLLISSPGAPGRKASNPFLIAGLEEIRSQSPGSAASSPVQSRRQIFEPDTSRSGAESSPVPRRLSFNISKPVISNLSGSNSPRERSSNSASPRFSDSISTNIKPSSDALTRRGPSALLRLLEKSAMTLPPPTGREPDSIGDSQQKASVESIEESKSAAEPMNESPSVAAALPASSEAASSTSLDTDSSKSSDSINSSPISSDTTSILPTASNAFNQDEASKTVDSSNNNSIDDDEPPPPPSDSSSDDDSGPPPPPPDDSDSSSDSENSASDDSEPPEVPSLPAASPLRTPSSISGLPVTPLSARTPSFKRQSQMVLNNFFDSLEKSADSSEEQKSIPVPILELPQALQDDIKSIEDQKRLSGRSTEESDDGIVQVSVAQTVRAESSDDESTIDNSGEQDSKKSDQLRRKPSVGVLIRSPSAKITASPVVFRRVPLTPKSNDRSSNSSSISDSDDDSEESPPPAYDAIVSPSLSGSPGTSIPFPKINLRSSNDDRTSVEMDELVPSSIHAPSLASHDQDVSPPSYRTAVDYAFNESSSEPATPRGERQSPEHDEELKRNILNLELPEDIIQEVMSMDPEARANWFRSIDTVRDFPEPPPLTAHSPHPARHLIKSKDVRRHETDLDSSGSSVERIPSPREIKFDPLADDTPAEDRRFGPPRVMPSSIELGTRIANSFGTADVRMFGPVRATRGMFMSKEFKRYTTLKNKEKVFEPNTTNWRVSLVCGIATIFLLFAMNCLDLAVGAYTDMTLLNFAGLSFVAVEISLVPFAIPPLWKKLKFLHSNFEVKVSRAKHPRYERVGLPVLAGFLLGATIVLWFISLTASSTASNYNAFLIFTCPQPLLVLGLSAFWKRERPYMTAIIAAIALSGGYIFLLWDASRATDFNTYIAGYSAASAVSIIISAFFVFVFRRAIQVSGVKWTVFVVCLIASCCCFGLSIFFVSSSPWFSLTTDYTARGAAAALPILLRAVVGALWLWSIVAVFRYSDLLISSLALAGGVLASSPRVFFFVKNGLTAWEWYIIVGTCLVALFFIVIVTQILSLERRVAERDANERSKFREKIAAAKERAELDIISPRSELEENINMRQQNVSGDGSETPTWSYWNASSVKSAAHYHPSTPHGERRNKEVIARPQSTAGQGNFSEAAKEMSRRSTYGTARHRDDLVVAHDVTVSMTPPPPTYSSFNPEQQFQTTNNDQPPPRMTVIGGPNPYNVV